MVISKETRAVIIALHKNGLTGKSIAARKIAPQSTIYRIIKNFKERGSIVAKKAPGRPRKTSKRQDRLLSVSATGSGYQQCRVCSGMAAGRCECICTHCEAETLGARPGLKEGSKEATSLQKKHQGQTDILQKCLYYLEFLPSDACKIYKQGINIRLDTTLIDFTDMKCQRGDLSFIFNGDAVPSESFVVLDNEQKVYQRIHHEESEMETEEEVDILMSSDIYSATLSTKSITFSRAQTGWLFREDKTERVGNFLADFYLVNGLVLESRKRREHLSEEDILRNKAIMESLSKGGNLIEQNFEPVRRQSLTAPTPNTISWEEYITAETGKAPHLGRELVCKESKKNFKATVAMSQDFPLGIESLLNVLEVIAPFKHFNKLREFVQMKLPPGFPVKLDIPVFPTITATVTFQEFRYDEFEESIFTIPNDYKEDPSRFPDL
ncbi:hypothetical protein SRHO_G00168700 [Serrasalmus rhombeus]